MFRTLSASIIRSIKNCSSSHWCVSWVGMMYIQWGCPSSVATALCHSLFRILTMHGNSNKKKYNSTLSWTSAIEWGWGGVKTTPGSFTHPERGPVLKVHDAYIRFTNMVRRLLHESDVGPSVKGQVQACYIYHGSQKTARTKPWILKQNLTEG
jgi:hypothetical protein